jgi:predicted regulator of Ras-like GTPase activity (Roadblock/LC7/MglB family)
VIPISEHVDELRYILQNLMAESDEIQGLSVVSVQGLPIVSLMDSSVNDGIVSAMAAAIQSVGERAAEELARGKLRRIMLDGETGQMIMNQAGEHAILVTLVKQDSSLGVIFMLIESFSKKIAKILDV